MALHFFPVSCPAFINPSEPFEFGISTVLVEMSCDVAIHMFAVAVGEGVGG